MSLNESQLAELKKLGELKSAGVLSDEEFAQLKEEILAPAPTHFDVYLISAGNNKIPVIKEIRRIKSWGLKEAKEIVDNADKTGRALLVLKADADTANAVQAALHQAGATTAIVPSGADVPPPPPPATGAQPVQRPNLSRNASPVDPKRPRRPTGRAPSRFD